jgi:hypothetical protein
MKAGAARIALMSVVAAATGAAAFRIVTAPERVMERRNTARSVCTAGGGEWVTVRNEEFCRTVASATTKS